MSTSLEHDTDSYTHPMDAFVPDPAGRAPLTDEATFAGILASIVADAAPRVFAVMQEYGDRVDARVVAWGLDFGDSAAVVDPDGGLTMRLGRAEDCLRAFRFGSHISARLVRYDPSAATPDSDVA